MSTSLDSISVLEGQINARPGDPIPPPTEREAALLRAEKDALVDALTGHLEEIERLRIRTLIRLQQEAYRRLSRAAGGRTLNRLLDQIDEGEKVLLEHKTSCGETVCIKLTREASFSSRNALMITTGLDERAYIRLIAPAAICLPIDDSVSGDDMRYLISLCETISIDPE